MTVERVGQDKRTILTPASIAVIALALAICSLASCSAEPPPPPRNVVFIVVDTLRRDHLGAYGYSRDTSPSIDRLAREGVRFERAYATAGWTAPSVASMLTGLYPSAHGVVRPRTALAEGIPTLPVILRDAGFATGGVVSNRVLGQRFGMARGYEHFDETFVLGHRGFSTTGVTTKALEMLDILESSGERFLLFVHYFDPHYAYQRHDSYGFAPERVGRLAGGEDIALLRQLGDSLSADEIAFLRDLYDGEIRFTDDGIGQLMDALREKGLYDDTLVVFVADHGEEFLERGWLGHTRTLYDELIRVPLILRLPRATRRRVIDEPVSLTSLAPTLLELLELPVSASFPAPSLVPQLRQRASSPDGATVLSEVDFVPAVEFNVRKTAKQASLVGPRYKLIRNELEHRLELYDMQTDPAEAHDVAEKHTERVQSMAAQLDVLLAEARAGAADAPVLDLSGEEIRALQELGYGE